MDQTPAKPPQPPTAPPTPTAPRPRFNNSFLIAVLIGLMGLSVVFWVMENVNRAQISYGYFLEQLNAGNIAEAG
jgi:hypothetical protein